MLKIKFGCEPARRRIAGISALLLAAIALLTPDPAAAQSFAIDLGGEGPSSTARIVQLVVLLTVLSLAPSILVVATSFTRIVVVLSFLRSALGTQQAPPNIVLISLALFLTAFIMAPTFETIYDDAVQPLLEEQITEGEALTRAVAPMRTFMLAHVRDEDLQLFLDLSDTPTPESAEATPMKALAPAFMISELRRAFEIGFLIFIPFLVIDMLVASVLMSMGMMMLPPVMISLPFKLIFFVLVDGWRLIAGSLVQSYG